MPNFSLWWHGNEGARFNFVKFNGPYGSVLRFNHTRNYIGRCSHETWLWFLSYNA